MVEQPAGTVTLVFTDIEGSTRLLRELGQDAHREALAEVAVRLYERKGNLVALANARRFAAEPAG